MYIKQLYTACLSEAAYYIEDQGEAAIIDPIRDIDVYLDLLNERKATLKYIFETHFHADFVSGHLDLAKKTGAPVIFGPETDTTYKITVAKDGEEFKIGNLSMKTLHTPGHTLESTCYLLHDEKGEPYSIFTGDTLFVGDVGRPDLSSGDLSSEELASLLYKSLEEKIKPLADHIIVYPAHGPGSACGKNIGPETQSTIGSEKETNYALKAATKEEFVKTVTAGLMAPPPYFTVNAKINKDGYDELSVIREKALSPVSPSSLKQWLNAEKDLVILDTRQAELFVDGFVPGSMFIGLEGRFAEWAGTLLPYDKDILLVTDEGKEEETMVRLARVGFNRIIGYLEGGFPAWRSSGGEIDLVISVEADELMMDLPFDENLLVLDVRKASEFEEEHLDDAENLPLDALKDPGSMALINETDNLYVHCAGGYRSVVACSLLKRQGLHNIRNVLGGWTAIKKEKERRIEEEKEA